jgi:hypothetical protein
MQKSIDIITLSNTFKDAITVTRSLGLRFLWIDSLCIIQDSLEDWATQSAVMGKIYENSICNIAATAAEDGRFGCFFTRNPLFAQPCKAIVRKLEDVKDPSSLSTSLHVIVPQRVWRGVDRAAINTRAWVVQERILAPRTIHFGQNQLFWECRELVSIGTYMLFGETPSMSNPKEPNFVFQNACEIFPDGLPKQFRESQGLKSLDPMTDGARIRKMSDSIPKHIKEVSDPVVDSFFIWNRILTTYTRCYLTRDEDKLIAISAIARRMQPLVSGTYLAGLWTRHLPYHLLWHAWPSVYVKRPPARCKSYSAPSWSWASINGDCNFYESIEPYQKQFMIEILEAKVTTKVPDRMGQVVDGYIKLRCWLKPLYFRRNQWHGTYFELGNHQCIMAYFDVEQVSGPGQWFFMPILEIRTNEYDEEIHGLILSKADAKGKFQRSGKFEARERYFETARLFRRPVYDVPINESKREDDTGSRAFELHKTDAPSYFETSDGTRSIEDLAIPEIPLEQLIADGDGLSSSSSRDEIDKVTGPIEGDWVEAVITII